jgi:hypothetical protein
MFDSLNARDLQVEFDSRAGAILSVGVLLAVDMEKGLLASIVPIKGIITCGGGKEKGALSSRWPSTTLAGVEAEVKADIVGVEGAEIIGRDGPAM